MFPSDSVWGILLISQFCVGVTGNSSLFLLYSYTFFFKPGLKKPIDSIFMHLTIVNMLLIIFVLIPGIMSSFGAKRFLDDAGCKAVLYVHRVTRSLSICTTSILSTFQAITISPRNSKWAWLKPKLSTWIIPSFLCSWLINMFIYISLVETIIDKTNSTQAGNGYYHAFCQSTQFWNQNSGLFFSVVFIRDLFFVVIMTWTSLYMVILLYRHHKRIQHLHSKSLSSQPSAEHKAMSSILLLVSCLLFYWISNFISLYEFYRPLKIPRLERINSVITSCFPTICPFLLMKNNKILLQFIHT